MMPKCCEKCDHVKKDHCPQFKRCPAWRSWFSEQWKSIRAAAAEGRGQKIVNVKSSRGPCTYATDPAAAMEYPGKVRAK